MHGHQGSTTIDAHGRLWLPYDLARVAAPPPGLRELKEAHHAARRPFSLDFATLQSLHIVNAMGVALGDSIIGLGVLWWLKQRHPHLRLHLHRASLAPRYVEELYELAAPMLGRVNYLPSEHPRTRSSGEAVVDLGDFAFWPQFARMPMVDFFLWALGICPESVGAVAKANRWLAQLELPAFDRREPYVLFFPTASSALRSMPQAMWPSMVSRIWKQFHLPVLGTASIAHPRYTRIELEARDMSHFLSSIRSASAVISVDTAAVHAAAGFDVPCIAFLNTIAPTLRTSYYPLCAAVDLRVDGIRGLHHSSDKALLALAEKAWVAALETEWPTIRA